MTAETLRDRVIRRMIELADSPDSGWTVIGTARAWRYRLQRQSWNGDTYDSYVSLTLVAGTFILGTSAAPWMGRQDRDVPLWLVEAILEDPELALDTPRQFHMRQARKAVRR